MKQTLSLIGMALLAASGSLEAGERPNIILILADDMRGSALHFLGKEPVQTPNLDRLAAESIQLTNAHIMGGTSGAVSMPSRAMLMTGKYLYNLERQGADIPTAHTTIGEALQQAGYNAFHTGKWHSSYKALNRCFNDGKAIFFGGMWDHWNVPLYDYHADLNYGKRRPVIPNQASSNKVEYKNGEYIYSGKHSVDIFTHEAVEYIRQQKGSEQPFFLSIAYMSPHDPRSMPDEYLRLYEQTTIALPPNFKERHPFDNGELEIRDEKLAAIPRQPEEIKRHIKEYYAMVSHVDRRVGDIIQALKDNGLYENSIIVFAGDNGLALGQHGLMGKQNVYEHSVNVPLLIKQATAHPSAEKRADLCYLIDLFPTLCDMAQLPIPASVDGVSLLPALQGGKPARDYLYYSYMDCQRAISDSTWKLIEYHVDGKRTTQLFNLQEDPYETTDLSAKKRYREKIKELREQMLEKRTETHDTSPFWNNFRF